MGLIKTTIKYGIPIGFVYWTIESREWRPMEADEELKKSRLLYKEFDSMRGKIEPYVKPYLPEKKMNIPLNGRDLMESYNEMVKKTFASMSNFDLSEGVKKLVSKLEKSVTEGSTKDSNTSTTSVSSSSEIKS